MKLTLPLAFLFLLAFVTAGCNHGNHESDKKAQLQEITLDTEQNYSITDTIGQSEPPPPQVPRQDASPVVKTDWDKKIVKTATLQAEVKDFGPFSRELSQKVKSLGGYISQEQQNESEYRIENSVTIKVPVHLFDQAVETILKDVQQVNTRQISSEDVSSAYIDGKSRLEAKKQVRLRYLELLKSARNMSDMIDVQKEINSIQEEIELVSGRLNYLGHASAMSTIHFTYYQVLNASHSGEGSPGFLEQLKDSFANGWYWLGELLLGLVAVWPLVLLGVFIALWVRKRQVLGSR